MTITILAAGVFSLIPLSSAAQEYLEPENGVLSVSNTAYGDRIREVFAEGYRSDVLLKAIILDASSTESLIAIRQGPDGLETVHLPSCHYDHLDSRVPDPKQRAHRARGRDPG